MAKEGSSVSAAYFLFLAVSISLAASQSVPPFYAGSYLESSDGQGEAGGGFYYGSPPQHFYYSDADSEYLNTNSYHASSPYQEEARIASYEDGNQFYPQEDLYSENFCGKNKNVCFVQRMLSFKVYLTLGVIKTKYAKCTFQAF